jgi:hypothetical protein
MAITCRILPVMQLTGKLCFYTKNFIFESLCHSNVSGFGETRRHARSYTDLLEIRVLQGFFINTYNKPYPCYYIYKN